MTNQKMAKLFASLIFVIALLPKLIFAQNTERPMIWVIQADREVILNKIKSHDWANKYFDSFKQRVQPNLDSYQKNAKAYMSGLPFDVRKQEINKIPPFKIVLNSDKDATTKRNKYQHYLKAGIDCGVLYYLT